MKKLLFQLICGLFVNVIAHSQQVSPSLVTAAGGISKVQGISLEWTLGEIAIETVSTYDRLYTQGFHQPVLLVRNFFLGDVNRYSDYKIMIAPNPVQSTLRITYSVPEAKELTVVLSDFTGKQLNVQRAVSEKGMLSIDMSGMIAGFYLLSVQSKDGTIIQSFKVIKGQ